MQYSTVQYIQAPPGAHILSPNQRTRGIMRQITTKKKNNKKKEYASTQPCEIMCKGRPSHRQKPNCPIFPAGYHPESRHRQRRAALPDTTPTTATHPPLPPSSYPCKMHCGFSLRCSTHRPVDVNTALQTRQVRLSHCGSRLRCAIRSNGLSNSA